MASLKVDVDQAGEFFRRFCRFGGSMAKLQKLLGNDELMEAWVKRLDEFPEFRLVHGVFNTTVDVLAAFQARCAEKGINFGKFSWVGSEAAPDFDPKDPETVVVLDATLDTLGNTFEFAWAWTVDGQDANWRWSGMVSDADKLRFLSDNRPDDAEGDSPDFKPWTLAWRRIKLNTFVSKKPKDVRNAASSPGCALLFMSAQHPARIKAADYKLRFGFWIAGLKCTAPSEGSLQDVPCMVLDLVFRRVSLGAHPCGRADGSLAVPSFRE